jgi:hopanoid C-3 methylase
LVYGEMEPYALEVLGACLRKDPDLRGQIEVEILDLRVEKRAALAQTMDRLRPQVVGVTGITIDQPLMVAVAGQVKAIAPQIKVVVGGHHATMMPSDFFQPCIDLIVRGPGTEVLPEVVKRLAAGGDMQGLAGVIYRTDDRFFENSGWRANIGPSNLLSPDRSLVTRYRKKYRFTGLRWGLIVTAQGCPFRCTFCACWRASNGQYLTKSPEQVIEEIAQVPEPRIFIGDDHTFHNAERAAYIADLIAQKGIKKIFNGYSRADTIVKHPELFRAWANVGLGWLTVGFESVSDEGLRQLNKGSSVSINEEANAILLSCGIHNLAHMLIDPSFTREDFKQVRAYTYKLGVVHPVFPILTPLPGTDLWDRHADQVRGVGRQYFDLGHPTLKTRLPLKEFYAEFRYLHARNYSMRRWVLAKGKTIVNALGQRKPYPWYACRTPEWYSILLSYWFMWRLRRNLRNLNARMLLGSEAQSPNVHIGKELGMN